MALSSILAGMLAFLSEPGNHDPMPEDSIFVTRPTLADPNMMSTVAVCKILLKGDFLFQVFNACTQFAFVTWKKNGVDYPEINFRYFVTIGAKEIFDCYVHDFNYLSSTISSILPYNIERNAVLSMA